MSELNEIWSLEDAAKHFRCSTKTVQKMTREHKLPFFMLGKLWRFRRDDVLIWQQAQVRNAKEVA